MLVSALLLYQATLLVSWYKLWYHEPQIRRNLVLCFLLSLDSIKFDIRFGARIWYAGWAFEIWRLHKPSRWEVAPWAEQGGFLSFTHLPLVCRRTTILCSPFSLSLSFAGKIPSTEERLWHILRPPWRWIQPLDKTARGRKVTLSKINKLAKARKTRNSPGTLGLKKFWPGKLWVTKNISQRRFLGQKK